MSRGLNRPYGHRGLVGARGLVSPLGLGGGGGGVVPIIPAVPPALGSLVYWLDGQDLDGQNNTTLTVGQNLTSVVNKGSRGGFFTPPAAPPKYALASGALTGAVVFAGGDRLVSSVVGNLPQPNTICIILKRTAAAANCAFVDGLAVGARQQIGENNVGWIGLYSGTGTSSGGQGTTVGKYNVAIGLFNHPAPDGFVALNHPLPGQLNLANGDPGIHTPTGLTIGSDYQGTQPLIGEALEVLWWAGIVPRQDIANYVTQRRSFGFPCTNAVVNYHFSLTPTTPKLRINGGDTVAELGDSLTHLYALPANIQAAVNASLVAPSTWVDKGVGGDTIALMDARVNADVVGMVPQPAAVLIQEGVNESFAHTPADEFLLSAQSVINKLRAGIPGVRIGWLSTLCRGEFFPDPLRPVIDHYDALIAHICSVNNLMRAYPRPAQQIFEAATNTPPPGNNNTPGPGAQSLLTIDGVHPTNPLGVQFLVNQVLGQLTFAG